MYLQDKHCMLPSTAAAQSDHHMPNFGHALLQHDQQEMMNEMHAVAKTQLFNIVACALAAVWPKKHMQAVIESFTETRHLQGAAARPNCLINAGRGARSQACTTVSNTIQPAGCTNSQQFKHGCCSLPTQLLGSRKLPERLRRSDCHSTGLVPLAASWQRSSSTLHCRDRPVLS